MGKNHRAYAKKEVVISAGAIGSAKILMLSGIGDPQMLQKAGVCKCKLYIMKKFRFALYLRVLRKKLS